MNKKMLEPMVTISWCPQDLINQYDFSEEKAVAVLSEIAGYLEDRQVEQGWETIETLIAEYSEDEEDED